MKQGSEDVVRKKALSYQEKGCDFSEISETESHKNKRTRTGSLTFSIKLLK